MIDISMAGAKIVLNAANGAHKISSNPITEFSDENTPIDIPALEVAAGSMNLNGNLVTWTKPNPINVSFTLIPGSKSDMSLRSFLRSVSIGGKGASVGEAYITSMVLTVPAYTEGSTNKKSNKTFTFTNGRLLSGQPAIGSNNDGKASPSTWTFMFEGFEGVSNN